MYQPMYGNFNPFNHGFGPQTRPGAFGQPGGYSGAPSAPQSASASVSAPASGGFLVQPVTSREEALAVIADPLSSGMLMPDLGHGVIYMKRFNTQTGVSDFAEFAFVQPRREEGQFPAVQYATVEQLNAVLSEIEALKKPVRKEKKNESDE